jgi:hypothetical protein
LSNYTIPCDTFVRLATIAQKQRHPGSGWMKTVRVENGIVVASNRALLVVERLDPTLMVPGIVHIHADATLVEKCRAEIMYHSNLFVAAIEAIGHASAKTTLGYMHPGNAMCVSTEPNELDTWRDKVPNGSDVRAKSAMRWDAELIALLAAASPSGFVTFPQVIDATQPIVVRDPKDPRWFGVFLSQLMYDPQTPAAVPEWF